ncbi:D-alanyl-D-alanine carboxypeptidase, partial [Francisella tularensis subsp. holarctica]|uniref:D-alanyl-D-alanine carboxypeptidase n=1 Tax=Francisella tularensis TaxID=263 RepID=UPI002381BEBA
YKDNTLVLNGCSPSNSYTFSFAIEDPQQQMQQAVLDELAQLKISLDTQIKTTNKLPDNLTILAKHKSADLTQLLKHMFVTS